MLTLARACVNLKTYLKEPYRKVNTEDGIRIHADIVRLNESPQLYPLGHGYCHLTTSCYYL